MLAIFFVFEITEIMELLYWKISEDLYGPYQFKILHRLHLLRNKWEVYCEWFRRQLCIPMGAADQADSSKTGRSL